MSRNARKFRYKGKPSEKRESIEFEGYQIQVLKHGNTGLVLYKYPSKMYNWEGCWTSCIESAKTGVEKFLQQTKNKKTSK